MKRSPELWDLIILESFVLAIGVTVSALLMGDGFFWSHLLYIPVILASYRYRTKGIIISTLVPGISFLLIYIITPEITKPVHLIGKFFMMIMVSSLVSYVSSAIHEDAEKYGGIFEHSGVGFCLISHPGFCITEVNPVFSEIFGYGSRELVKSRFAEIWKKSEMRDEFFTTLREKGEATSERTLCHKKDGSEVEVIFSGRWLSDEIVICTASELPPTDEGDDPSDNKYRKSLDSIQEAIQIVDRDLNLVFSNVAHSRLCTEAGVSCDPGKPLSEIFPFIKASNVEGYREVLATGTPHQSEKTYDTPSGRIVAEEIQTPVMHDGRVEHIVTVIRDVTAHRDTETALSRSEDLYRTVFETTGTAMMILDEDGTIALSNGGMEKSFGYRPESVQGKRIWGFFASEEDVSKVMLYHHNHLKEGSAPPQTYESRLNDARGMKRDVILTVKLIPGTRRCVISLLDVTAGKQAERLLRVVKGVSQLIVHEPDTPSLLKMACNLFSDLEQAFMVSVSLISDEGLNIAAISDTKCLACHEACLSSPEMAVLIDKKVSTEFHEMKDAENGEHIPLRTLAAPMVTGGEVLGVLIFSTTSPVHLGAEETEMLRTLAGDLAFAIRSHDLEGQKSAALSQIEQNMEQFAILNDEIRNPLQGIVGLADLEGSATGEAIIRQADLINGLVGRLDQRWLESEKIRDFLHKHYDMDNQKNG